MEREDRYLVIKRSDIKKHLTSEAQEELENISHAILIGRDSEEKPELNCVVVEHDWPEYETVWEMIENRVDNGTSHRPPDNVLADLQRY